MKYSILVIGLLLIGAMVLSSCSSEKAYMCIDGTYGGLQTPTSANVEYYCPDGRLTKDVTNCKFYVTKFRESDALSNARNYLDAYATANGLKVTANKPYKEEGNWFVQALLSNKETSYETTIKIDGIKGIVSCYENCDLFSGSSKTNITNN